MRNARYALLLAILILSTSANAQEEWYHPDSRMGMLNVVTREQAATAMMYSQNRLGKTTRLIDISRSLVSHYLYAQNLLENDR